jgi:hypothetical protein
MPRWRWLLLPPDAGRGARARQSDGPLLAAAGEFRNPVEGGHGWRAVAITADGEHVLGAWGSADVHCIFAWSRFGRRQLTRILEGAGSSDDGVCELGVTIPGHPRHGIQGVNTWGVSVYVVALCMVWQA